jgi:hypothetical protein
VEYFLGGYLTAIAIGVEAAAPDSTARSRLEHRRLSCFSGRRAQAVCCASQGLIFIHKWDRSESWLDIRAVTFVERFDLRVGNRR